MNACRREGNGSFLFIGDSFHGYVDGSGNMRRHLAAAEVRSVPLGASCAATFTLSFYDEFASSAPGENIVTVGLPVGITDNLPAGRFKVPADGIDYFIFSAHDF